ncbi:hypothetical protein [Proteus mirabilis]|nr:hypothetical protein [Proteus mirabilis]
MSNALLRELVLNQALKVTPFTYLDLLCQRAGCWHHELHSAQTSPN